MRNERRLTGLALIALFAATRGGAQSIRGTIVDAAGVPVAGGVLQLLDSLSAVSARALSTERGEFRLVAPRPGTYRVRSLRIGFTPWTSATYTVAAGATLTERITLANVAFGLDTIRIAAVNSCKLTADSGAATFAVWQQARTALLAADLTRAARNIASTTVLHERRQEPDGRHTISQKSTVHSEIVKEPWLTIPPAELHRRGYVVQADDFEMTYYAPGIDMLVSEIFMSDHCFHLRQEKDRVGIAFEPARERGDTAEIRGTIWLDKGTSALTSMEFKYVNLPRDFTSDAGGDMEFARFRNGAWAIARWDIRMGIFERHTRSARLGGSGIHLAEMQTEGGELVLAMLAGDTLFAQAPRVLRGVVRDSMSNAALRDARVSLAGTSLATLTDAGGHFSLSGVLPGIYSLEVRTASLDSVSALHRADVEFIGDAAEKEIRVLSGTQIIASVCKKGEVSYPEPGVLLGRMQVSGADAVPADARIIVSWSVLAAERLQPPSLNGAHGTVAAAGGSPDRIAQVAHSREVGVARDGTFRVCGIPVNHELSIEAESDSGHAEPVVATIPAFGRFARADMTMTRSTAASATFSGSVVDDEEGVPVADAEVSVGGLARTSRTDVHGHFLISGVGAGSRRVTVRKLGFTGLDTTLVFSTGALVKRTIRVGRAVSLSGVEVRARRVPISFDEHLKVGLGSFITAEQLDSVGVRPLVSVLSQLRGIKMVFGTGGSAYLSASRMPQCYPVQKVVKYGQQIFGCPPNYVPVGNEARCASKVFVDGVLLNDEHPPQAVDLREFNVMSLAGVEWYAGAAEAPMEYTSGGDDTCGVLVMWTRRR